MTPPTQDDLAAGRRLDAEVAEKVLGARVWDRDGVPWMTRHSPHQRLPNYSTDIGAAWEIVEHMDSLGWKVQVRSDSQLEGYEADGPWVCVFASRDGAPWASADTAPMAICRAALAAVSAQP